MTAVSLAVTGAPALVEEQSRPAPEFGLAVYVGLGAEGGAHNHELLIELSHAVAALVAEYAPGATTRSALSLGSRSPHRELVNQVRAELAAATVIPGHARWPVTQRTERLWRDAAPRRQLIVDSAAREVTLDGTAVALTFKEFALLEYLLRAPHRAITREELLTTVWHKRAWKSGTRTIDVHVRRLRDKLGGCLQIVTVRGVGYRCDPTPEVVLVGSGDAD
jgi:hypothetical protein